jgi:hypothetical protein
LKTLLQKVEGVENSGWKENYVAYKEPDLSMYDNRYCIYWYRYEKDYKAPAAESLLPDGWRRLNVHDAYIEVGTLTQEQFSTELFYILKNEQYKKAEQWESE